MATNRQIAFATPPLRVVLYARVSTDGQSVDSQLVAMRQWATARGWSVVAEHSDDATASGWRGTRRSDPPGLRAALNDVAKRKVEVLATFAADRLVASPVELLNLVARVQSFGAHVASYTDGSDLDTTTPTGELLTFIRGWWARMERKLIVERTVAGLHRARERGQKLGRPACKVDRPRVHELRAAGYSFAQIAKVVGTSKATVARIVEEAKATVSKTPLEVAIESSSRTDGENGRLKNEGL